MLFGAWALGWLTGYLVAILTAGVQPRKSTRPAELCENGHQAGEPVPPVQTDPLAHTTEF